MRLAALLPLLLFAACARRPCPAPCLRPCDAPPSRIPAPALPPRAEAPPPPALPHAPGDDLALDDSASPADRAVALRTLPKEARWARARREVGLFPEQERALREAVVARDASLEGKTGIVTRLMEGLPLATVLGDDDEWFTLVETGAVERADAGLDERATAVLDAAQRERWHRLGYARAFGRRLPHVPTAEHPTYFVPPDDRVPGAR